MYNHVQSQKYREIDILQKPFIGESLFSMLLKKKLNKKSKENKSVPKVKVKKVKSESFRKSKNVNLHRSDFV